jgi:nitrate/nitrite-specific signal transduction histidine kinase
LRSTKGSDQKLVRQAAELLKVWITVTVAFIVFSTLVIYDLSRRITQPIKWLTAQAGRIAEGLLDQKIPVTSRDEVGQLAASFNEMAAALQANIAEKERALSELQELNRTLEQRIRQRTAEIE